MNGRIASITLGLSLLLAACGQSTTTQTPAQTPAAQAPTTGSEVSAAITDCP